MWSPLLGRLWGPVVRVPEEGLFAVESGGQSPGLPPCPPTPRGPSWRVSPALSQSPVFGMGGGLYGLVPLGLDLALDGHACPLMN